MDRCDLQGLVLVERRQQAGQAAGQEGLAGARRAAEQQVVRRRRPPAGRAWRRPGPGPRPGLDKEGRAEQAAGLVGQQRAWPERCPAISSRWSTANTVSPLARLASSAFSFGTTRTRLASRRQRGRQYASHWPDRPGQGQFAKALQAVEGGAGQRWRRGCRVRWPGRATAVLGQVGGGEVEGDAPRGKSKPALSRALRTRSLLAHRGFRQADQGQRRQAVGQVRLDADAGASTPTWARLWTIARTWIAP